MHTGACRVQARWVGRYCLLLEGVCGFGLGILGAPPRKQEQLQSIPRQTQARKHAWRPQQVTRAPPACGCLEHQLLPPPAHPTRPPANARACPAAKIRRLAGRAVQRAPPSETLNHQCLVISALKIEMMSFSRYEIHHFSLYRVLSGASSSPGPQMWKGGNMASRAGQQSGPHAPVVNHFGSNTLSICRVHTLSICTYQDRLVALP